MGIFLKSGGMRHPVSTHTSSTGYYTRSIGYFSPSIYVDVKLSKLLGVGDGSDKWDWG